MLGYPVLHTALHLAVHGGRAHGFPSERMHRLRDYSSRKYRKLMSCPYSDRGVEKHSEKQKLLLLHYHEHVHNKFNKYAFCFFFCELLNILISVSQVIISYNCTMPSYFTLPDIRDSCFPELSVPGLWVPCLSIL